MEFSTEGEKKDSDEEDITDARVKLREMGLPKVREHEGDYTRKAIKPPICGGSFFKS